MAYSLGDRFSRLPKNFTLIDPGAYETRNNIKIKPHIAPFLSKTPRVSQSAKKIWTHAMYYADTPHRIPNCSSMMSKLPRFTYQAFSQKDLDSMLCQCGIQNTCECEIENDETKNKESTFNKVKNQRKIFIGHPPRSMIESGLSVPSKNDNGFIIFADGTKKRRLQKIEELPPPIRDVKVNELTAFYKGCKWSRRTSSRTFKNYDIKPGPADYTLEKQPTLASQCTEKIRASRCKFSKQYRYIEAIQLKNFKENHPGPGTYDPRLPKGPELQLLGSKAERFLSKKVDDIPGPSDYRVKRDFDIPELQKKCCLATLPERAPFGVKSKRFMSVSNIGPGPAFYDTDYSICQFSHCQMAPFGSSSARFTDIKIVTDITNHNECSLNKQDNDYKGVTSSPNWMFKSRTKRLKPLKRKSQEPGPADFSHIYLVSRRSLQLQNTAPFHSSEARFQPWHNWIPVQNVDETPGPGKYRFETFSCIPAVIQGPIFRSERFKLNILKTPASNAYKVGGGLEEVLHTHNQRLKENIKQKHTFHWYSSSLKTKLTNIKKESLLFNRCIALLNTDIFEDKISSNDKKIPTRNCNVLKRKTV
ncbi:unnamed protein product [Parnassius apollo]|uniref:(apollo) hypothetical protein n=1 Tax=Parnassius apollo TaxID=110799 RepID=A0A8S3W075_PARAO|nr:unnamed protein product [Parnassius apollo]